MKSPKSFEVRLPQLEAMADRVCSSLEYRRPGWKPEVLAPVLEQVKTDITTWFGDVTSEPKLINEKEIDALCQAVTQRVRDFDWRALQSVGPQTTKLRTALMFYDWQQVQQHMHDLAENTDLVEVGEDGSLQACFDKAVSAAKIPKIDGKGSASYFFSLFHTFYDLFEPAEQAHVQGHIASTTLNDRLTINFVAQKVMDYISIRAKDLTQK